MSFKKILKGYKDFRKKYAQGNSSIMEHLAQQGQQPETMVVTCCDSRVDPALIFQCDPGDLFVVRNIANIVPPYQKDLGHHGVSAALEYGICYLGVKELIILGHSQCGGMKALLDNDALHQDDFITSWLSLIKSDECRKNDVDECAKVALQQSYQHCMQFPWIKQKVDQEQLSIHLWFFDIKTGQISECLQEKEVCQTLD